MQRKKNSFSLRRFRSTSPLLDLGRRVVRSPQSVKPAVYQQLRQTVLGNRWIELFDHLASLGPVLTLSGNPYACIGSYLDFSELAAVVDHSVYFHRSLRLEYRREEWHKALSIQTQTPNGISYSITILDQSEQQLHKICLTPCSSLLNYSRLTELLQNLGPVRKKAPSRWSGLQAPPLETALYGDELPSSSVRKLIAGFHQEKLSLKATIHNSGLSHQTELQFLKVKDCEGSWIYAEGKESGIHLRLDSGLRYIIQDAGHCQPRWKLLVLSRQNTPLAELASVPGPGLDAWNHLFESI